MKTGIRKPIGDGFQGHTGIKSGMRAVLEVGFPVFPRFPFWVQDVPIWVQDVPIWGQDVPCASLVPVLCHLCHLCQSLIRGREGFDPFTKMGSTP